MKPAFIYMVVDDLKPALAFYRDELGLDEAWREGEGTVAFMLPGSDVQIMVDERTGDEPKWSSGPMFQVDDLDAWLADHSAITRLSDPETAPGIRYATVADPDGNAFHVFELDGDEPSQ